MDINYDLLKAVGFSDAYIEHIKNFNKDITDFTIPSFDISNFSFTSTDATEIKIDPSVQESTSIICINPQ